MYNTRTATTNNEEFNSSYMPVGINDNVTLNEVTVGRTTNGRDYLRISFINDEGQTAEFTEWPIEKNQWVKTDEDVQVRSNQQFGRILQIINCFFAETPEVELKTFVDMANWVKTTLDSVPKNENKLRLKVIYDKNGYTRVSSNGIYVEPMSVEKTQIKLFKRDTLERVIKADVESSNDPLSVQATPVTANSTGADDLPF